MGLTSQSTGLAVLNETLSALGKSPGDIVIALAGNPNTGKSTVFNGLTGLKQHTGNWPGKTVATAYGRFCHRNKNFVLVDLPGTYSLMADSVEEVARDFICFAKPDVTVVVTDATCLERNLYLVLQIMEITSNVVICLNLLDEARRKKIYINLEKLSHILGVPVVGTCARDGTGLFKLKEAIYLVATGKIKPNPMVVKYDETVEKTINIIELALNQVVQDRINPRWAALRLLDADNSLNKAITDYLQLDLTGNSRIKQQLQACKEYLLKDHITDDSLRDRLVFRIVQTGNTVARETISREGKEYLQIDRKIDNIVTSRVLGIPIMLSLLGIVFWITIKGANYPSQLIARVLFDIEGRLTVFFASQNLPEWMHGVLVLGMYRTLAWVISVMLPPMAIFFPFFTLLEDLGYLPRVAFNLDSFFKKACAHGKQALTMCMGFGCNAAGVIACRIIESPRERLIATVTNSFVPCNGRFPTLIALTTIFIAGSVAKFQSLVAASMVLGIIVLGVAITLTVSRILSKTVLKGLPSSFTLELPPYRKPQVGQILIRSLLDRTLFVLARAVSVAAPAGTCIWLMANMSVGGSSLLDHAAAFLHPFAHLIGLDGYILMAFILGLPANEIVIPIIIMSYMHSGTILELENLNQLRELLVTHGWTWLTAVCTMLFSLNHWPCGTTLLTIKKETQSLKWTLISFLVPTLTGIIVCTIVAQTARLLGLV